MTVGSEANQNNEQIDLTLTVEYNASGRYMIDIFEGEGRYDFLTKNITQEKREQIQIRDVLKIHSVFVAVMLKK